MGQGGIWKDCHNGKGISKGMVLCQTDIQTKLWYWKTIGCGSCGKVVEVLKLYLMVLVRDATSSREDSNWVSSVSRVAKRAMALQGNNLLDKGSLQPVASLGQWWLKAMCAGPEVFHINGKIHPFSQLYMACSWVGLPSGLFVYVPCGKTTNIVYKEILSNS